MQSEIDRIRWQGRITGAAAVHGEEQGRPDLRSLFLAFLKLGLTAFGGPAMVFYIRELAVGRKKWLSPETFRAGVVLCQSIPGATAIQMAAYVGLRTKGILGGLASYAGFGLPAFCLMLIFSALYTISRNLHWVTSLFAGLQLVVVAVVANATYTFGRASIRRIAEAVLASGAAVAFWFGVSPFLVILAAACAGALLIRTGTDPQPEDAAVGPFHERLRPVLILLAILSVGLACLYFVNVRLFRLALLMLRIDLFAFGGGFASVPLMLHEVVEVRGFMDQKTFMDGIALGQVTPGPIVITSTFVGYSLYGLLGAVIATVAIFTPSFVLLVMTEPIFHKLKGSPIFVRATNGILASFVGLLLYVTLKFAVGASWNATRVCMVIVALVALLKKVDILYVVLIAAMLSIVIF